MQTVISRADKSSLKQIYQEHITYIKQNDPQSAHTLHILSNNHEYSPINNTITLTKQITNPTLLFPFEHLYIQSHY
jgi:hypothetical protein